MILIPIRDLNLEVLQRSLRITWKRSDCDAFFSFISFDFVYRGSIGVGAVRKLGFDTTCEQHPAAGVDRRTKRI
jgi:hypothetical protein